MRRVRIRNGAQIARQQRIAAPPSSGEGSRWELCEDKVWQSSFVQCPTKDEERAQAGFQINLLSSRQVVFGKTHAQQVFLIKQSPPAHQAEGAKRATTEKSGCPMRSWGGGNRTGEAQGTTSSAVASPRWTGSDPDATTSFHATPVPSAVGELRDARVSGRRRGAVCDCGSARIMR